MDITIHTASPEPVYEQIVRQVHAGVADGRLAVGTPLPTVRQLAADLMINRNTVARAYKTLEEQGVIRTAGRKGTFVGRDAAAEVDRLKNGHAERIVRETIEALTASGMRRDEIAAIFHSELRLAEQHRG